MDEEQHLPPAQRHRVEREEVAGHDAGGLPAQELTPGGPGTPWRGLDAVGPEHLGCRAGRHPMPEAHQLTLDALLPPSRVVDSQPHDQSGEHLGHRGPADAAVGRSSAGQPEGHASQAASRAARRTPTSPPVSETDSARQARPIGPLEARARPLAAQDLKLVAQHQDLDLLGLAAPEHQHHERQHPADGEVHQRPYFGIETISLAHGDVGPQSDPSRARTPWSTTLIVFSDPTGSDRRHRRARLRLYGRIGRLRCGCVAPPDRAPHTPRPRGTEHH